MKILKIWRSKKQQTIGTGRRDRSRAQAMVETALILPVLMVFFGALVDGGLALNTWLRVNTAARDATRFALDAGKPADVYTLAKGKLEGVNPSYIDVYYITGQTQTDGTILNADPYWNADTHYGTSTTTYSVKRTDIETSLKTRPSVNNRIEFVIVEVDARYIPMFAGILNASLYIPMSSYAIIQTPAN